ncbi:MAG TPA: glycosyltransferase family 4 protein [Burkholderiaceae bacterium]|nr:glycosyltransferase family 4 protein [Burkholderiaceae bacterium]
MTASITDPQTPVAPAKAASVQATYLLALPWGLDAIGGVTQVVVGLYDGIGRDARLRPKLLVSSWGDLAPNEMADEAGRSIIKMRVRGPFAGSSRWSGLLRYLLSLPRELLRIRALVRQYAVEVVNFHYIGSSDFTWVLAKRLGIFRGRVLLSMHGLDIRTLAALHGWQRRVWRWALMQADAVVACSEGLAEETVTAFDLPRSQVVTIHNGVDVEQLERVVTGTPAPAHAPGPALLNLGTFEHKKGHDVLLRAFRRVVERYPSAHLTIMGRSAETTQSTLALVDELELAAHTTIRTDVPHAAALRALAQTDVFVLSSRNEAFSIALLEAGALGKPVVATNVCGVAELIRDGFTGVQVPPENVQALADGILRLLADRECAAGYGRRLRDLVQSRFTLEENSRSYLRLAGYQTRS